MCARNLRKKNKPGKTRSAAKDVGIKWWILLLVAAIALGAYAHTLRFEFVYDDDTQVLHNPWIKDWANVGRFFTTDVWRFNDPRNVSNYYRPVHMLLHTAGYSVSGLDPAGYHAINIVFHAICSCLVALIGFRISRSQWLGLTSGLIFALHPIHAESVAWIAGITDPACALFFFAGLYFHCLDGEHRGGRTYLYLMMACFFLSLLSKEMAFTFPLVAVFMDWCLRRELRWSRYAMMLGVFAAYSLMRISALGQFHVRQNPFELSWDVWLLSTIELTGTYLSKLLVPYDINAFHVFSPATSLLSAKFLVAAAAIGAYFMLMWSLRRERDVLFSLGFCLISLLPVLNITGIGENVFADRYMYIPTLGISLALPLIVRDILSWLPPSLTLLGRRTGVTLLFILLISYGWVLANTTFMWRNSRTLFSETIKRSPNAALIANSMAADCFYRGERQEARKWFQYALTAWDNSFAKNKYNLFDSYSGLGAVALYEGDLQQALENFKKAEGLFPNEIQILQNLGVVYATMNDYSSAMDYYRRALALKPESEITYNNLAALHIKLGHFDEAIQEARKALEIYPRYGEAYLSLGRAYAAKSMLSEARDAFEQARRVDPNLSKQVEDALRRLDH